MRERRCSRTKPLLENDPYSINATGFSPDPRRLQFADVGPYIPVLSCIRPRLARNGGGGSYTLALGCTCGVLGCT